MKTALPAMLPTAMGPATNRATTYNGGLPRLRRK